MLVGVPGVPISMGDYGVQTLGGGGPIPPGTELPLCSGAESGTLSAKLGVSGPTGLSPGLGPFPGGGWGPSPGEVWGAGPFPGGGGVGCWGPYWGCWGPSQGCWPGSRKSPGRGWAVTAPLAPPCSPDCKHAPPSLWPLARPGSYLPPHRVSTALRALISLLRRWGHPWPGGCGGLPQPGAPEVLGAACPAGAAGSVPMGWRVPARASIARG